MNHQMKFRPTISIANNGTTYLYDTTYDSLVGAAIVGSATRGRFPQGESTYHVAPTAQAVTVYEETLTKNQAGTEAWQIVNGAGAGVVVAAGDYQEFTWNPGAEDHRVRIVNGATGPTALACGGSWVPVGSR